MPMPVSATAKTTASPAGVSVAETRMSPCSVNLRALERKLRKICDTLPSSLERRGLRLVKDQGDAVRHQERAQHAAQSAEEVTDGKGGRPDGDLAGFDFGQIE